MSENTIFQTEDTDSFDEMPDYSAFFGAGAEEEDSDDNFFLSGSDFEDEDEDEDDEENFAEEKNDDVPEFYVLWNTETDFYYFTEEGRFYVFSDENFALPEDKHCVAKTINCSPEELFTVLYNQGFIDGYMDNKIVTIKKSEILYLDRNPNNLYYQRYKNGGDRKWLGKMQKQKLWTLCKITKQNEALFAIVTDTDSDDSYLLAFTEKKAVSREILEKYPDFVLVRNPLKREPFLLNYETTVELDEREV